MPKRFKRIKAKRRRGKKFARRGKRKSGPTTSVMRGPSGFPDRIRVKLNYYTVYFTTNTLGTSTNYQFRGNSLFDPDFSLTGGQPNAFDQWKQFYGKYRVSGSKVRVVGTVPGPTNMSGSDIPGLSTCIVPTISSTTTTVGDIAEMAYSKIKTQTYYSPKSLSSYMTTAKLRGVNSRSVANEDNNSADISANPVNTWFWNIFTIPANTTQTTYWTVTVKLTYYAEFFNRLQLGTS